MAEYSDGGGGNGGGPDGGGGGGNEPKDVDGIHALIMSGDPDSLEQTGKTFGETGKGVESICGKITTGKTGINSSWKSPAQESFELSTDDMVTKGNGAANDSKRGEQPLKDAADAHRKAQSDIQKVKQDSDNAKAEAAKGGGEGGGGGGCGGGGGGGGGDGSEGKGGGGGGPNQQQFDEKAQKIFKKLKGDFGQATARLRDSDGQGDGGDGDGGHGDGGPEDLKLDHGNGAPGDGPMSGSTSPDGNGTGNGTGTGNGDRPLFTPGQPINLPQPHLVSSTTNPIGGIGSPNAASVIPTDMSNIVTTPTDPSSGTGLLSLGRTLDSNTVLTGLAGPLPHTVAAPSASIVAPSAGSAGGSSMGAPMFGAGFGPGSAPLTSAGRRARGTPKQEIEQETKARPVVSLGGPGMMSPYVGGAVTRGTRRERTTNLVGDEDWSDEQIPDNTLGRPGSR
jgi:hypothetical protein